MNSDWERAATLGAGVGLVVGSLAMWHTDPSSAFSGVITGLALCVIIAATSRRSPQA